MIRRVKGKVLLLAAVSLFIILAGVPVRAEKVGYKVVTREINQVKDNEYDIGVKYPQIQASPLTTGQVAFNNHFQAIFNNRVSKFMKDLKQNRISREYWGLAYQYDIMFQSESLISVLLSGYENTGGAHPSPESRTILYDLKKGRVIRVQELFKPGSPYLKTLSNISKTELKKHEYASPEFIDEGTSPKLENFENFYLTDKAFVVHFPTYQVAPYVMGPQKVSITYEKLRNLIDPSGPLGRFVK